jgi:integrase/recombinase XerD
MPQRKAPPNTFWRGSVLWGYVKVKGRRHRWSLRTDDIEIARARAAAERERQIAAAHYGDDRKLFADLAASWAERHIADQVGPRTALRYAVSLKQLQPFVEGLYQDEVNKALVERFVEARRDAGTSIATVRRDLTALSSILQFAIDKDWRDDNPALAKLRRLKERRDPIVLPEPADIRAVIVRAPGRFAALIEVAWRTGCRLEELARAERSKLDHTRKQLTVRGKRNKVRVIDLEFGGAYELLRGLPVHLKARWLFWHGDGEPYRNVSSRFAALVRRTQKGPQQEGHVFTPFRFHDLRHRHAVDWLKSGRSIYDLQQRLGHSSVKTTEIYLMFLTPEEARAAKFSGPQTGPQVLRSDLKEGGAS